MKPIIITTRFWLSSQLLLLQCHWLVVVVVVVPDHQKHSWLDTKDISSLVLPPLNKKAILWVLSLSLSLSHSLSLVTRTKLKRLIFNMKVSKRVMAGLVFIFN